MCQGLNSHYFHIIGDGHQPNSRGLYTHYKDSLLKVGWPSPIYRLLTMAHMVGSFLIPPWCCLLEFFNSHRWLKTSEPRGRDANAWLGRAWTWSMQALCLLLQGMRISLVSWVGEWLGGNVYIYIEIYKHIYIYNYIYIYTHAKWCGKCGVWSTWEWVSGWFFPKFRKQWWPAISTHLKIVFVDQLQDVRMDAKVASSVPSAICAHQVWAPKVVEKYEKT